MREEILGLSDAFEACYNIFTASTYQDSGRGQNFSHDIETSLSQPNPKDKCPHHIETYLFQPNPKRNNLQSLHGIMSNLIN
nr:hypothetical protein Iba_chr02aCG20070 [Ipomoea batatas]GMC63575.1 hypothetical protein Iba_chr02cCG14570 [Ipomoea batatas]GME10264.1 hypothetical protein Iba_scaffold9811CG0010 [Ipomoea batatas]